MFIDREALLASATGGVILAHGAMGPWDDIAVGVPVPALFVILLIIGRRSKRIVFEDDEDLEYSGADSYDRDAVGQPAEVSDTCDGDVGHPAL